MMGARAAMAPGRSASPKDAPFGSATRSRPAGSDLSLCQICCGSAPLAACSARANSRSPVDPGKRMIALRIGSGDLDPVILDHRIREQLLAHIGNLCPRRLGVRSGEIDLDQLALADALDALESQRAKRMPNCLGLWVEHTILQREMNSSLHGTSCGVIAARTGL